jgi:2-C-methyl-D-erythritol 4-phosphate cytidylyltransferase
MTGKRNVIITAGGNGTRMNSNYPKQFMLIHETPVLMRTISCFYDFDTLINIIITLPNSQINYWRDLCSTHNFTVKHSIVIGGHTRFHSVKNALALITEDSITAIHDGVRPFIDKLTIGHCFSQAELTGSAVPVIECVESLRQVSDSDNISIDRSKYRIVQTPQVFRSKILLEAYKQTYMPHFTDDASVVEHCGYKISLVEGNRENMKITSPFDMLIAETILNKQK